MAAKRVLVPIDFSKTSLIALNYAIYVANRLDANIDLLHIAQRSDMKVNKESAASYKDKLKQLEIKLDEIKNSSGAAFRIQNHVITTNDSAYIEIIKFGKKHGTDLAFMGTYGSDSSSTKNQIGDNADKLVHDANFPIITCSHKKEPLQFKNLLLPIDLTKHTVEKVERIIRFALSFDSTIHLVAVSEFFEEITTSKSKLEDLLEEAATTIRKNGIKCITEIIRHDFVINSILEYETEIDADLLVIMSVHENKFNQLLLGSRTNKVIANSKIPVLSFRPLE